MYPQNFSGNILILFADYQKILWCSLTSVIWMLSNSGKTTGRTLILAVGRLVNACRHAGAFWTTPDVAII
jgi:hypothetical protein